MEEQVFVKIVRPVTRVAAMAALSTVLLASTASAMTVESPARFANSTEVDAHSKQVAAARTSIHITENTSRLVAKRQHRAIPVLSKQDCNLNGLCRRHLVLMLGVGF